MKPPILLGLLAGLFCTGSFLMGQDFPADAPRKVQQVTLSPPREASVRQKSGPARIFTLISLTEDTIKVRTSVGKEVEIAMDKIKTVRTRDGQFDYSPDEETFASLLRRASRITGVTVATVDVYDPIERIAPGEEEPPPPAARNPTEPPAAGNPAVAGHSGTAVGHHGAAPPGFHSANRPGVVPAPVNVEPTQPQTEQPSSEAASPAVATSEAPGQGTTIYTCANCSNELPAGIKNGDRCPHCGIVFWNAAPAPAPGSNPGADSGTAGYPAASGYPASTTTTPVAAPSNVTPGVSNSFSDVPMWMKVAFFVGLLVIGWLLLQRR